MPASDAIDDTPGAAEGRGAERPTCPTCPYWLHGYRGQHPDFGWITERVTKHFDSASKVREVREPIHFGDCRRHAARPIHLEDGEAFGRTHRDDWCGDHPDFDAWRRAIAGAGAGRAGTGAA